MAQLGAFEFNKREQQRCKTHADQDYVVYCERCYKPCCQDCLNEEHLDHELITIEEAAKDATRGINTYMETLETVVLPSLEQGYSEVMDMTEQYTKAMEDVIEDSKSKFRVLREELDQAERNWMQQLNTYKQLEEAEISRTKNDFEEKRTQTKDLIATCKEALREFDALELVLFRSTCRSISHLKPSAFHLPTPVEFHASNYMLPKIPELIGRMERKEVKRSAGESSESTLKEDKPLFLPNMVEVTPVNTYDGLSAHSMTHTEAGVWINYRDTNTLTLYGEDIEPISHITITVHNQ